MGIFDYFMSGEKKQTKTAKIEQQPTQIVTFSPTETQNFQVGDMNLFYPQSFEDVSAIIEILALGKPVYVNLRNCKAIPAQRVIDMLSGAIYALHGNVCQADNDTYLFSLNTVSIKK